MSSRYRFVLMGAGRVATHLALALQQAGHTVLQVYSRTEASASELSRRCGVPFTTSLDEVVTQADYYIFSVKDDALEALAARLAPACPQACFLHTAGSMPLSLFAGLGLARYGVLYPLQTFSKERALDFSSVPLFIEASSDAELERLSALAYTLSRRVVPLSSEKRRHIHLAAVFACNFVNHCYAQAADLLEEAQLPFDLLLPLIDETAAKVHELSPFQAQTGPAVRYDRQVIGRHLDLLSGHPSVARLYREMSESIHEKHRFPDFETQK